MHDDDVRAARDEWLRVMLDSASTDAQCAAARAALKRAIKAGQEATPKDVTTDAGEVPKS